MNLQVLDPNNLKEFSFFENTSGISSPLSPIITMEYLDFLENFNKIKSEIKSKKEDTVMKPIKLQKILQFLRFEEINSRDDRYYFTYTTTYHTINSETEFHVMFIDPETLSTEHYFIMYNEKNKNKK